MVAHRSPSDPAPPSSAFKSTTGARLVKNSTSDPAPPSSALKSATGARLVKTECPKFGTDTDVLVRVECNPGADLVSCSHTFLCAYCEANFPPHIAQRLTVAAFELLENGMQYGGIRSKVVLELLQRRRELAIRVSNEAIPARINQLREQLARINGNAEAVFLEEFKRSISGPNSRAMLGLARVAHEAQLKLFAEVVDQRVIVIALCSE